MPHPIVIQDDLGLIEGIHQAGSALGGALEQRFTSQRQQEGANILQNALQGLENNPSPLALQSIMNTAIAAGAPPALVQNMGSLYATLQNAQPKYPLNAAKPGELSSIFQDLGLDPDLASKYDALYPHLTTGGQTAFANTILDRVQRAESSIAPSKSNQKQEDFQWPAVHPFSQLTPKEKVSREKELFQENVKLFNVARENLSNYKNESLSIRQLKTLNNSGKLPSGKTKIFNVNHKTGDLRIPAAANAETQLFVKNINRFLANARQFFGGRVTNFEVEKYLQGLPTLANSTEGRMFILEQMDLENQLRQLDEQAVKEVLQKYGTRGIDPAETHIIADQWKKDKEQDLLEKFDRVSLATNIFVEKENTPKGHVLMEINGKRGYVPESEVPKAKQAKGIIL